MISAAGGSQLKTPAGWPSCTGVSAPHMPAHEQIHHPTEVALRVVAGQPPRQIAVQHHAVEQRLQRIVGVQHGLDHAFAAVVGGGERRIGDAQPVGLVVHDHEPLTDPQHRVHRARQVSPQRLPAQRTRRQPARVGRQRVVGAQMLGQQCADVGQPRERPGRDVAAGQWELEVQLPQPVRQADLAQRDPGRQRAQVGVVHRDECCGQLLGSHRHRPARGVLAHVLGQFGGQIGCERVGGLQHRVHQRAEGRPAGKLGHRRGHIRAGSRCHQRDIGHLIVEFGHLRLTGHRGLFGGPQQTGVRGAPPRGVDGAVEMAHREFGGRRWRRCRGDRLDQRFLQHRAAGFLPRAQPGQRIEVGDLGGAADGGHLGLAGRAAPHQPRQPAVGFVPGRRPPRHHLRAGARHRHVGQSAVIGGGLGLAGAQHHRIGVAHVEAADAFVVVQHRIRVRRVSVERERQIHDRVLQALGDPHRHDLHRGGVTVEATVAFGRPGLLGCLGAQPVA